MDEEDIESHNKTATLFLWHNTNWSMAFNLVTNEPSKEINDNLSTVFLTDFHINLSTTIATAGNNGSGTAATNNQTFIDNDDNINENYVTDKTNFNNYWGLLALILVIGTAAGNILVCLAIAWERRLQNVTNYFLMSLAITDLMVAILVMPLGILTLVKGYFPLQSEHCLAWICLDVLFCTASIMHLCTISVDRYLSLRYPMRFGRNKTRRRVTLKIIFVWLLSIAMSLPLSLMYSKDNASSLLVNGTCQIPDPVYKLVGSIVCFYIPLCVMLLTYCLTVRLLARQQQNLGIGNPQQNSGWSSGWLGSTPALERRCTWRRLLKTSLPSTPNHAHSAASTDTELSTLDTHELWLPDTSIPDPTPSTMTALHQFGAEMLKLSRGLESVSTMNSPQKHQYLHPGNNLYQSTDLSNNIRINKSSPSPTHRHITHNGPTSRSPNRFSSATNSIKPLKLTPIVRKKRRASHSTWSVENDDTSPTSNPRNRKRFNSLPRITADTNNESNTDELYNTTRFSSLIRRRKLKDTNYGTIMKHSTTSSSTTNSDKNIEYLELPPPCTCPYFGDRSLQSTPITKTAEVKIMMTNKSPTNSMGNDIDLKQHPTILTNSVQPKTTTTGAMLPPPPPSPIRKLSYSKTNSVVTWDSRRYQRRGSSFGGARTSLLLTPTSVPMGTPLRRSATLRNQNKINTDNSISIANQSQKAPSSPCLLQRSTTIRSHHSRNSSVISRNSSRHGRIIRLEQKATKVLGVVFFTFVILWAPFFVLNLVPSICSTCEQNISHWVFDIVTWLGYASSMVNPIFYTIFNKVFRQAFKKVLLCKYNRKTSWRPHR